MKPFVRSSREVVAGLGTLVVAVSLTLTAASPVQAAPARVAPAAGPSLLQVGAAPPAMSSTSFYASTKAKSSTKKALTVTLSGYMSDRTSFNISLRNGGESHSWSLPAPKGALKISRSGKGSLKLTPKQAGKLGQFTLKVKPVGKMKSLKCGGKVYATQRNLKVTGKFYFNTKTRWGKVGSKTKPFAFKSTRRVTHSYDVTCPDPEYPNPCSTGVTWSGYTTKTNYYVSISGGNTSRISGFRSVQLKSPSGASRFDSVYAKARPAALTVNANKTARLKVSGTKGTGSVKSSAAGSDYTGDCDTGTQHTMYWNGSFSNGKPPLAIKAQVFGDLKLPNKAPVTFHKMWRTK